MNYTNLVCIVFLRLSRIVSVPRVLACSYCDVLIFLPTSVVISCGDILSLRPVLTRQHLPERISRGVLPSERLWAALGICLCVAACCRNTYPQRRAKPTLHKESRRPAHERGQSLAEGCVCVLCPSAARYELPARTFLEFLVLESSFLMLIMYSYYATQKKRKKEKKKEILSL